MRRTSVTLAWFAVACILSSCASQNRALALRERIRARANGVAAQPAEAGPPRVVDAPLLGSAPAPDEPKRPRLFALVGLGASGVLGPPTSFPALVYGGAGPVLGLGVSFTERFALYTQVGGAVFLTSSYLGSTASGA
jgi:hypothetical protein